HPHRRADQGGRRDRRRPRRRSRHGIPAGRHPHVAAGRGQHRFRPEIAWRARVRIPPAGGALSRRGRPGRTAPLLAAPAVRRHAQAGRHRRRLRQRPRHPADGRTLRRPGLFHPRQATPPAHPAVGRDRQDHLLRHPRHRRGARPRRPHPRPQQRRPRHGRTARLPPSARRGTARRPRRQRPARPAVVHPRRGGVMRSAAAATAACEDIATRVVRGHPAPPTPDHEADTAATAAAPGALITPVASADGATDSRSFGVRARTRFRPTRVLLGVAALIALWEAVALWFARTLEHPEYVMPELGYVLRVGLPGLSDYYSGVFGGTPPSQGGGQTVVQGLLSLVGHSGISLVRVGAGLALGTALGIAAGLAMAALRPVRYAGFGVANLLRMLPLLALGPLFTLWLGPTTSASVTFICFAVTLTMLVATSNAIGNLDPDLLAYPRTLGLSTFATYRRVVAPAIIPELAAALTICGPLAWSVLLAS